MKKLLSEKQAVIIWYLTKRWKEMPKKVLYRYQDFLADVIYGVMGGKLEVAKMIYQEFMSNPELSWKNNERYDYGSQENMMSSNYIYENSTGVIPGFVGVIEKTECWFITTQKNHTLLGGLADFVYDPLSLYKQDGDIVLAMYSHPWCAPAVAIVKILYPVFDRPDSFDQFDYCNRLETAWVEYNMSDRRDSRTERAYHNFLEELDGLIRSE